MYCEYCVCVCVCVCIEAVVLRVCVYIQTAVLRVWVYVCVLTVFISDCACVWGGLAYTTQNVELFIHNVHMMSTYKPLSLCM